MLASNQTVAAGVAYAAEAVAESQIVYGDANGDGKVDAKDASAVLRYYAYVSTGGKDPIEKFLG